MPQKKRFLKFYLFIALLFGCLGVVDGVLPFLLIPPLAYLNTLAVISLLFFLLNIMAFFTFWHQQQRKITYVLPVYHVFSFILFIVLSSLFSYNTLPANLLAFFPTIGIVLSVFEIFFSGYLLRRFELFP
ncbi:MAG: hypothetical protein Q8R53_02395 [Nanoarchaeota archaeon]|nr:hypothetical protein [Nanoarchaeota archaeon]